MAYFEPTSSERRGIVVLCVALALCILIAYIFRDSFAVRNDSKQELNQRETATYGKSGSAARSYAYPERKAETFAFDPNEADSTTLLRLGFAPWQVRGIYKYRALGGRYHELADVQRIPGMTNELWDRLAPYVRIGHKYQYVTPQPRSYEQKTGRSDAEELRYNRDTVNYPLKLKAGQTIALNEADTNALKKIPGIGSYYAGRIVRYRNELGGFVSMRQLQEIEGMPEGVEQWLSLDTAHVKKIDVNHATKSQLVRHPYLRAYRAGDIWQWRHNYGAFSSIEDLRKLPNFTEADIDRLRPYLVFR